MKSQGAAAKAGGDNGEPVGAVARNMTRDVASEVFERLTVTGRQALQAGGELVPRKEIRVELDGGECAPGVYVDEAGKPYAFWVTLRALSSAEEIDAVRGAGGAAEIPYRLAKACVHAINDRPVSKEQRDLHWECFGPAGRQILMTAFHVIGSASGASVGKALSASSEG